MRLFVALRPPEGCLSSIEQAALPLKDALGVKVLPSDNWHITLKFIGEAGEKKAREIEESLSGVKFPLFEVRLFGAGAFPSPDYPRAIWIGGQSQGALRLANLIEEALEKIGIPKEARGFGVHLTVARSKAAGDIKDFLQKTGEVGSFEARFFALMKSRLLPQGASYEVLKEFAAEEA